jgi:hypothetical protein
MENTSLAPTDRQSAPAASPAVIQLRQEYLDNLNLVQSQPPLVQRFLESQAAALADSLLQGSSQARFSLPDRIVIHPDHPVETQPVPGEIREQMAGRLMERLTRTDLRTALRQRLVELEQHTHPAVAASANLLRFTIAMHMVHNLLPSGRGVTYSAAEGEEIPSLPTAEALEAQSAITAPTDAIVEEGEPENGRGDLLVPYVAAARRFYLPQWVAFDDAGRLLVNNVSEAEAHVASMQRYLFILHTAVGLAPCMVADDEYQQKRYGILGQLVNQGRALARYQVQEIIGTIQRRAASQDLNRGLSLSLPFFNDQKLELATYDFEIIPTGRIMFVKSFVVRAAREQEVKVAQDTRLSPSSRKHLLEELEKLGLAFS